MPRPRSKQVLEAESTSTSRSQTTIQGSIYRDGLMDNRTVVVTRNDSGLNHDDPVVDEFLAFLDADIQANSSDVRPIPQELLSRARGLTASVTVSLDGSLDPEDELPWPCGHED